MESGDWQERVGAALAAAHPTMHGGDPGRPQGSPLREGCRIFSTAPVQLCEATGCPLTNAVEGGTIGGKNGIS